jgi:DNA helicase-4
MEYEDNLRKENAIDFDDMIIEGRKQIKNDGYKYIIVDEFQDISQARAKLLKELKNTNNAKLYCVGDDWQAINQFNGGDISIFTKDFERLFGFFERVDIDTTFRFGEKINELSSKFIQKNPSQLNKNMNPFKQKINGNI